MVTTVQCETIVHETDAAILVRLMDGREVWLPLSQVNRIVRRPTGDAVLTVSDWIADKEDL